MKYKLKKMMDIGRIDIESAEPREEVGYINFNVRGKEVEICDLFINVFSEEQNFRGKGYGSMLVKELLEYAKSIGAEIVFGQTQIDDYPVHAFYKKHGFSFDETGKDGGIFFRQTLTN